MELQNESDLNNYYEDEYEENNSDIESRLYAEIYYSNNDYEETNVNNSKNNEEIAANFIVESNTIISDDVSNFEEYKSQAYDVENSNPCLHVKNVPEKNDKTAESSYTTIYSKNAKTNNSNKQHSETDINESERSKRTKDNNQDSYSNEKQSTTLKSVDLVSSQIPINTSPLQDSINKIINPYNIKNVDKDLKLLNPEIFNLFFANSKNRNKNKSTLNNKKNITRISSRSQEQSNFYNLTSTTLVKNDNIYNPGQNEEKKIDLQNGATVIDLSLESSEDSVDDSSKYKTVKATDVKLRKNELKYKSVIIDSDSDSEESIFEIPVPPKPAPPVIELKDSDAGSNGEYNSNSDEDSFLNDSSISNLNSTKNDSVIILDTSNEKNNIISDGEDSSNIILNCTVIQKSASSLDEIKRFNHQEYNKEKENRYTNVNVCRNETTQNTEINIETTDSAEHCKQRNDVAKTVSTSEKETNKIKKTHIDRKNLSFGDYFFEPMNDKMKAFYNDSWGGEDFDMDKIRSKMPKDPKKWATLSNDMIFNGPRRKRYFGIWCTVCQKEGHRQYDCPKKFKVPSCNMCGTSGHISTKCPVTQCLSCGRKQPMYRSTCSYCERTLCNRCKAYGHLENNCPDLWRRYHNTINGVDPKAPANQKSIMKSHNRLFCCNCAKQGHDSTTCRKFRWSQHFPNPSHIISYQGPSYPSENHESTYTSNYGHEKLQNSNSTDDGSVRFNFNCINNDNNFQVQSPCFNRNRNMNEAQQNSSMNTADLRNNRIIFKIESKLVDEGQGLKSTVVKLNVPKEIGSNIFENWKNLYIFLKDFSNSGSLQVTLQEKSNKFSMNLQCSRKYITVLSKLIKQYASRSSVERTLMFLQFDRNGETIIEHLSLKFMEMSQVNIDLYQTYEDIKQITKNPTNSKDQMINDIRSMLKNPQLATALQKLILELYREGCADDSVKQLRKLYFKLKKASQLLSIQSSKCNKKKRVIPKHILSIKCVFTYLYFYNNVFVPYSMTNLAACVQNYKEHINRYNKLKTNPLLFPPNQITSQNFTDKVKIIKQANPTEPKSSTSKESLPIERNSSKVSEQPKICSVINPLPQPCNQSNTSSVNSKNFWEDEYFDDVDNSFTINGNVSMSIHQLPQKSQCKTNERKLNGLYLSSLQCKSAVKKQRLLKRFQNFLKGTRHLLKQAIDLRSPHLEKEITLLQHKLKHENYVNKVDVKALQKLVKRELIRRS